MPKYRVTVPVGAWWTAEIEAESAEDAIEKFEPNYICAQCSGMGKHAGESSIELSDDADYDNATAEEVAL